MLEDPTFHTSQANLSDWQKELSWGDIVSFRFPVEDAEAIPKKRPCLVLDTATVGGKRYALLAYGTTTRSSSNRGYEIRLGAFDASEAGLHRPTRFVGARRLMVNLDHPGLVTSSAAGTPIIGRLSGAAFDRMNAVRGRIHAEADIAAERRAERRDRPKPRYRRTAQRDVVVELRHPPRRSLVNRD